MEVDVATHVGAVTREVKQVEREGKIAKVVIASRIYDTSADDLWNALTDKTRIPRWFSPVSGDFELGGRYQVEGNAGGEILKCDVPKELALTWEMGTGMSWLNLTLNEVGEGRTELVLEHIAHIDAEFDEKFGPGAVGVGWDLSFLGMALHLDSGAAISPEANTTWTTTDNYKQFAKSSSEAWRDAAIAAGTDVKQATRAAAATTAFYQGETPPDAG